MFTCSHTRRFIRKNLALTPLAVDTRLARVITWVLSRHLIISYTFYTAGARPRSHPCQPHRSSSRSVPPPAPPQALTTTPHVALVLFVLTLQKEQYGYQFKQLAWTHLIVFFTVVPSSFFVPLMFEGLVWFFLPCGLIIVNDIMAYLAGAPPPTCPRRLVGVQPRR